jgi:hypothetical protein
VDGQQKVKLQQVYISLLIEDTSKKTDEEKAVKRLQWMQRRYWLAG